MSFPEYTVDCPLGVYETRITVTSDMTDQTGHMGLGDLAREMEAITAKQLDAFGISIDEIHQEGKAWVIAWTSIEIIEFPKEQMEMILRVWPGKNKSMMYTRRYAFYTSKGEPLVCAASLFLLMDQKTRSVAIPTGKLKTIPVITLEGEPKLPKLKMDFPDQFNSCKERMVMAEEIDENGHLNNSHYLDWAQNLLEETGKMGSVRSVWVQYNKELREGQKVDQQYGASEDAWYLQGRVDGTISFQVKIK